MPTPWPTAAPRTTCSNSTSSTAPAAGFTAGGGLDPVPGLEPLVSANLGLLRTEFGLLRRQVSGYSLEHLLPENGASLARTLAGTEGTVVTMLGATVRLVPVAPAHALVVLGYPDVADAADAVPAILAHAPLAIEGLDARLVDVVRHRKGSSRVPSWPPGDAWLMVEMGAGSAAEAVSLAQAMVADAGAMAAAVIPAGPQASAVWLIREDGAGLGGRTPANRQAWPGWEDAAVQPDRLGTYLREFRKLLGSYQLDGLLYGHFGDGCIHVRIDFPLDRPGGAQVMRQFLTDAAHLVTAHGGSLSGGARRRPGPQRAAAGHVLTRGADRVQRVQAPAGPGRPAQPWCAGPPPAARRRPAPPGRRPAAPPGGLRVRRG